MSYEMIINNILYGFSGLCFGIFASRFSLLSTANLLEAYRSKGLSGALGKWYMIGFILCACFAFPIWFIGRTVVGGFVYYAVLIYFFNKGYRAYITGDNSKSNGNKTRGKKANKWR